MTDMPNKKKTQEETEEFLARVRRTISASKALIQGAELRIQETDSLLAEHGLTREQLMAAQFSPEQMRRVNEELRRRGLPPLDEESDVREDARLTGEGRAAEPNVQIEDVKPDMENRKRKFNVMMSNIRL